MPSFSCAEFPMRRVVSQSHIILVRGCCSIERQISASKPMTPSYNCFGFSQPVLCPGKICLYLIGIDGTGNDCAINYCTCGITLKSHGQ